MKISAKLALLVALLAPVFLSACTSRAVLEGLTGEAPEKKLHIWFVKPVGDELKLVEVSRTCGQSDRLKQSVEDLLRGPNGHEIQAGLGSEIPKGTILLGIEENGQTIELNLSRRFASGGGTSSVETRLEQLRRTIADEAGTRKVFLSVEGQRLLTASGEGLEVKQPIN